MSEQQPGFVECTLRDAHGVEHSFIEKVPVVRTDVLGASSAYPCPGTIECVVRGHWVDPEGRLLVRVTTETPWHVASTSGETTFVVPASAVIGGGPDLTPDAR